MKLTAENWRPGMPAPEGMRVVHVGEPVSVGAAQYEQLTTVQTTTRRVALDAAKARVVGPGRNDMRNPRVA